ncbi:glycosyltransferase family 2 protein [bacterium]|nr:glycosyltransferase family 2 protein [bacterium]
MAKNCPDKKIIVIMPAYNAEKTLLKTYNDIPKDWIDEIILTDDKSKDETIKIAQELGITTFTHLKNTGYGGNQKTCYIEALKRNADIIIMLHPDYQYNPKDIPDLIKPIIEEKADLVLGSRLLKGNAMKYGMPWWKFISNRFLTSIENMILEQKLSEYHTGYRAYSGKLLHSIPFMENSDDFVFDTQLIAQTIFIGKKIAEISSDSQYFKDASSISLRRSIEYGLLTLKTMLEFKMAKASIKKYRWLSE